MIVISLIVSFLGCISFLVGSNQTKNYNNGIVVSAVITDINTDSSSGSSTTSYYHTYYGSYSIDSDVYEDIKILKAKTNTKKPNYTVGQTIKIRVLKDNPTQIAEKGTVAFIVGFASFGIVILIVFLSLFKTPSISSRLIYLFSLFKGEQKLQ